MWKIDSDKFISICLLYVVYDFLFVKVHEFATSTFLMIMIYLVLESRIENSNLKYVYIC